MKASEFRIEVLERVGTCCVIGQELKAALDKHDTLITTDEPQDKLRSLLQALESCMSAARIARID